MKVRHQPPPPPKKTVLDGSLAGPKLVSGVKAFVTHPKATKTRAAIASTNADLLWFLANTPGAEDRAAIEETVCPAFEQRLEKDQHVMDANFEWGRALPIPRTYKSFCASVPAEMDLLSMFGSLYSETPLSQLLARGTTQRAIFNGRLPGYGQLRLENDSPEKSTAWRQYRLAQIARSRVAEMLLRGQHHWSDDTNGMPNGDYHVFAGSYEAPEVLIIFHQDMEIADTLQFLGLKNCWPIAYGTSVINKQLDRAIALLNYHVYEEFRGTPSSSKLFTLLLGATKHLQKAQVAAVWRGQSPEQPGGEPNEKAVFNQFLLRHGFKVTEGDYLGRSLGRVSVSQA
ncbi:MAG: hypothetical protein ABIE84_00035 [bacterium]